MSKILIIEDEEAIADLRRIIWSCPAFRWRSRTTEKRGWTRP